MPGVRLIQDPLGGNTPAVFVRFDAPGTHHSVGVNTASME